jgi:hypothetical protein
MLDSAVPESGAHPGCARPARSRQLNENSRWPRPGSSGRGGRLAQRRAGSPRSIAAALASREASGTADREAERWRWRGGARPRHAGRRTDRAGGFAGPARRRPTQAPARPRVRRKRLATLTDLPAASPSASAPPAFYLLPVTGRTVSASARSKGSAGSGTDARPGPGQVILPAAGGWLSPGRTAATAASSSSRAPEAGPA